MVYKVAPRAGAWIETSLAKPRTILLVSRPVRARGLKPKDVAEQVSRAVAPRAGAWIETLCLCITKSFSLSRPVRARGLKL